MNMFIHATADLGLGMAHESHEQPNGKPRARSVLPCPMCGTLLKFSLLEVEDEDAGTTDLLLLLDCPTGDYHGTLNRADITKVLSAEVIRHLQNDGWRRDP